MAICCCGPKDPGRQPRMPGCRSAEARLLEALPASAGVRVEDTQVIGPDGGPAYVHSVELVGEAGAAGRPPLVFLPGYGTGAAIWCAAWRHWLDTGSPLARRHLIAVDPLGWYLSSHPEWTPGLQPLLAEAWFVESLEAWRAARGFQRLDLLGHSIGGYLAACYAERHPERIATLVLLSPAGIPKQPPDYQARLPEAPWKMRLLLRLWGRGYTPHLALRRVPRCTGYKVAFATARRWLRGSGDVTALADYIYYGWTEGPQSGEQVLGAILHPGAWAKNALCMRIPKLSVPHVEFIYGDRDWMDFRHGNAVAAACRAAQGPAPRAWVQLVRRAGHYVHLENVPDFTAALARALGRDVDGPEERTAAVPEGFAERFSGPNVPAWRGWEGYEFGR